MLILGFCFLPIRRKQSSPESVPIREGFDKHEVSANGHVCEAIHIPHYADFTAVSPDSPYFDDAEHNPEQLDRRYI